MDTESQPRTKAWTSNGQQEDSCRPTTAPSGADNSDSRPLYGTSHTTTRPMAPPPATPRRRRSADFPRSCREGRCEVAANSRRKERRWVVRSSWPSGAPGATTSTWLPYRSRTARRHQPSGTRPDTSATSRTCRQTTPDNVTIGFAAFVSWIFKAVVAGLMSGTCAAHGTHPDWALAGLCLGKDATGTTATTSRWS